MGFRSGAYATVWEVKEGNGNYTDVRLSISRKDKNTDTYITDWSGFARFIGDAHTLASSLGEKSRIKLGDVDVTNRYDKDKQTTYTNYAVFGAEIVESAVNTLMNNARVSDDDFMVIPDDIDEILPFN